MVVIPPAFTLNGQDQIITAYTVQEIQGTLSKIQKDAVVFLDVDDTLITPQSKLFRSTSPYRFLIDDLKKNREQYPNFETILSHWRLQRKTMLVSKEWPAFIRKLKKAFPVYALTKMESGALGAIPSMEKWRYEELKEKDIAFTPSYKGAPEGVLVSEGACSSPATFYKGIFITGSFPKSKVLEAFLKTQRPSQVVLIDDRQEYLQDVIEECNRQFIPFLGILFRGIERVPGAPDPKVANFQKDYLFNHAQWLEDEEALKMAKSKGELSETKVYSS